MTTTDDIEALIARVALGDRRAFSALYAATSAKLFGVALRILDNRAEAEDTLQEVFVKVWNKAGQYRVNGLSPMTWLITVARNSALDRLRARRAGAADLDAAAELADLSPGPEETMIARSEAAQLARCLSTLDPERAEAVRRAYMIGESYAELAARFGLPLNTVRTWLRRGLQKLRDCLTS